MKLRFKKIKVQKKDDRIYLEYENVQGEEVLHEQMLRSADKARPEFHLALQALRTDVIEMCELPETDADYIIVKSISLSWAGPEQTMGCTITAQKTLKKSMCPLLLNTPHKIEKFYAEHGDERALLSYNCLANIREVIKEAGLYLNGERAQQALPLDAAVSTN